MKFVTQACIAVLGICFFISCLGDDSKSQFNEPNNCYTNPHADGSCPFEDIMLWLYTKKHPNGTQILDIDDFKKLQVNPLIPWKIYFHGFLDSKDKSAVPIVTAYLSSPDSTNILVFNYPRVVEDYQNPVDAYTCYAHSTRIAVSLVGRCAAQLLKKFIQARVMPKPDHLHLIGHSLGSQIASNACANLNDLGLGKVKRLTGLDPAGPCFSLKYTNQREIINPNAAKLVDVYHTDAGPIFNSTYDDNNNFFKTVDGKLVCDVKDITEVTHFGMSELSGTVDVIFNGGTRQPGCPSSPPLCHHRRSVSFFAESINPKPFTYPLFIGRSGKYNRPSLIGEYISKYLKGDVLIKTNAECPYAKGFM